MNDRCIDNVCGYCSGKPKEVIDKEHITEEDLGGRRLSYEITIRRCRLDHRSCGFFITASQQYGPMVASYKDVIGEQRRAAAVNKRPKRRAGHN